MLLRMTVLLIFLTLSAGCKTTSTYVLQGEELLRVKKDQEIKAPYDGWFLSDRAVKRVMDVKIKGVNLK